jgi:rhodanese-related sulfurtransferase
VRSASIVFCCDGVVRSAVAASWFRQMGYPRVSVVDGGVEAWRRSGLPLASGPDESVPFGLAEAEANLTSLSPADLWSELTLERPLLVHVGTSRQFARAHVPGARWVSRSWLELEIGSIVSDTKSRPIVVTDADGPAAMLAGATLRELGYQRVAALGGGMRAWQAAGLEIEQGLSGVMLPPDDILASGPERSAAEAIEYLRWETALAPGHAGGG